MKFCRMLFSACLAASLSLTAAVAAPHPKPADMLVYGGTASGVITAYSAAREGLNVVLLEPGSHLGGMVTGGLSATDLGHYTIIGGYARDFYLKVAAQYGKTDLDRPENWYSEPHVDEQIFRELLSSAKVVVHFNERVREHNGVELAGTSLQSITTEDGKIWIAKIFADCSYEGDLMAQSKVSYTFGREAVADYNESLAGVQAHSPGHQFRWPISAYNEHRLQPEVDPGPLAAPGSGDKLVQAYNLRVILTREPANRLPFPMPEGYDPSEFALLRIYLDGFQKHIGHAPHLTDITNPVSIPNNKADFNNNGPVSTDFIGHSWNYPDGTYVQKAGILREHIQYTKAFFYFITHDPSVPENLRNEANDWGLPKDEFLDNDHWPNQLYIREGRRMVGAYVMHQADLQSDRTKTDSIGMGSYNSDSHNVQRVAMPDRTVQNEGNVEVAVEPYEIPYRIITPKASEAGNLLVPVCVSATHVAYSSVRMEPQYMIMAQAAGAAASLAVKKHTTVQSIDIAGLQKKLRKHHAILSLSDEYHSAGARPGNR